MYAMTVVCFIVIILCKSGTSMQNHEQNSNSIYLLYIPLSATELRTMVLDPLQGNLALP